MGLYLGIDVSTQGVKCIVIDIQNGRIAAESSVNYGKDLPHYGSPSGFLPNEESVRMYREKLDYYRDLEKNFLACQE